MSTLKWNLKEDLHAFNFGDSGAQAVVWEGRNTVHLDGVHTIPVLLREDLRFDCFRIRVEVAVTGPYGFIGLAFGARDHQNYELVYLSPGNETSQGDIQYDPIMNGSSTWQIYNGPVYQASAAFPTGQWTTLVLEVQPNSVAVYVGDETAPHLVVSNLQHGRSQGRIGFWGNLPGYVSRFSVEETLPSPIANRTASSQLLLRDSTITEWLVSKPYSSEQSGDYTGSWTRAAVEENGCLNINRLYSAAEKGTAVQATYSFSLKKETESLLCFGFSDRIRLWINDKEVYQGETMWNPPESEEEYAPTMWPYR